VRPTGQLYTALIRSAGRAGDPLAATVYWNEMVEKGFKPNAVTYTELFSALARCQTVGQKNGTKFRCIPKPPWEFIGHDPTKMMASSKQTKSTKVDSMYKDLPVRKQGFNGRFRGGESMVHRVPLASAPHWP
jgi:pentatricopeptide repeat protein